LIFIVYFAVESKYLTFDHSHAIEWKECEFEYGSPIGNSTANLEGIRKLSGIFPQCHLPAVESGAARLSWGWTRAAGQERGGLAPGEDLGKDGWRHAGVSARELV
jgi:hypothetical protein